MSFELPAFSGFFSCLFHLPGSAAHVAQSVEAEAHVGDAGAAILAVAVVALLATGVQVVRHWRHDDGPGATEGSLQ
jgi:hypothetical protein